MNEIWIGSHGYTWFQYAQRVGRTELDLAPDILPRLREAGFGGVEVMPADVAELQQWHQLHAAHGLRLRSFYAGGRLHAEEKANAHRQRLLELGIAAAALGVEVLVCNPDPINWSTDETKSDDELRRQADHLEVLGGELRELGVCLAYHFHLPEFCDGGRELHTMMALTTSANVGLSLDVHWAWRGLGNSLLGVESLIRLYGKRVASVHLRQSRHGVWSESLPGGDIPYETLVPTIMTHAPLAAVVIETAWEEGSAVSADPLVAQAEGCAAVRGWMTPEEGA